MMYEERKQTEASIKSLEADAFIRETVDGVQPSTADSTLTDGRRAAVRKLLKRMCLFILIHLSLSDRPACRRLRLRLDFLRVCFP